MSTTAHAIKAWEAKEEGRVASEATEVKLYCQIPPINRLDSALTGLVACEKLSLSTNSIDRLISLNGMKSLKILSLGRNQIKKIEKLDDVAETLEELWISYNLISSLDGLQGLTNLTTLYMSNNQIKSFDELSKLVVLPNLRDVLFFGNPMYEGFTKEEAKIEILRRLPDLQKIDGDMILETDREKAAAPPDA